MIAFTVPGNPIPKGRPRRGRNGSWYTPQRTRDYERLVCVEAITRVHWKTREGLLAHRGPIHVELKFFRDSGRPCDVDNLAKAVCDALNSVVWRDDRQIKKLSASLDVDLKNPRVEIGIEALSCAP